MARFRQDLAKSSTCFPTVRSQFNDPTLFRCTSENAVFCDKTSIAFCEATLLFLDLSGKDRHLPPWEKGFIIRRRVCFWLKNLACYIGDMEMLQFYTNEYHDDKISEQHQAIENKEHLALAAARGHETILELLLLSVKPLCQNMALALRRACYSGNVSIAQKILQVVSHDDAVKLCSRPLSGWRTSVRLSTNYPAVAQIIDDRHENSLECMLSSKLMDGETSGVSPPGRNLLQHSQGSTTCLWPPERHCSPFHLLRYACLNRDVAGVRALLNNNLSDDFRDLRKNSLTSSWYFRCATYCNSFAICMELCRFSGRDMHKMFFAPIAGMDSSTKFMTKKFESKLDLLDQRLHPFRGTLGQFALRIAAERLRLENVKFLLQMGARITTSRRAPSIQWRYRRAHEEQFQAVQALLQQHSCQKIQVIV